MEEHFRAIDKVLRIHNKGGYRIKQMECDNEFKGIMDKVADDLDISMNYSNAQDHVPAAKKNNRTIKEHFRVGLHRTGYDNIPKAMIISLAEYGTHKLNMFPARHGVSNYYSPLALVTGEVLDYNKHCQHEFG